MKTSAIQTMVLQPINTDKQPKADADAPLFLPADARRRWYLGFLHHWKDYQRHVIQHWESEGCKRAFDEIKDHEMAELQPAAPAAGEDDKAPAKFETMFRREVLEIVESVYNQLLATKTMKHADACNLPEHIALRKTETDHAAKPRFWFRAKVTGRDEELRLFGHAEYLGGRPGALSSAVEQAAKNSWGSLRCVLGKSCHCPQRTRFTDSGDRRPSLVHAQAQHNLWLRREQRRDHVSAFRHRHLHRASEYQQLQARLPPDD